ncbi:MAG: hypothetical protein AAGD43_00860 [Pseudomonadota bacterium]
MFEKLADDGIKIPLAQVCRWFGVARRTLYYRSRKAAPRINLDLAEPFKELIETEPSFGYRTVAWLLGFNKKYAAADLSAQRRTGQAAPCWCTSQDQSIAIGTDEFRYICVTGAMDYGYSPGGADFYWQCFDEIDEVFGSGDADFTEDGNLVITIPRSIGDDYFVARPWRVLQQLVRP